MKTTWVRRGVIGMFLAAAAIGAFGCASGGGGASSGANRSDGARIGEAAGSHVGAQGRHGWLGSTVGGIVGRRTGEAAGGQLDNNAQNSAHKEQGGN